MIATAKVALLINALHIFYQYPLGIYATYSGALFVLNYSKPRPPPVQSARPAASRIAPWPKSYRAPPCRSWASAPAAPHRRSAGRICWRSSAARSSASWRRRPNACTIRPRSLAAPRTIWCSSTRIGNGISCKSGRGTSRANLWQRHIIITSNIYYVFCAGAERDVVDGRSRFVEPKKNNEDDDEKHNTSTQKHTELEHANAI